MSTTVSTDATDGTHRPDHASQEAGVPDQVTHRRRRRIPRIRGTNIVGILIVLFWIFPIYWMITTAFKQGQNILSVVPKWFPTNPTLQSFIDAVTKEYFWTAVRNSLIVVSSAVLCSTILAFLGAVAVARFRFKGRKTFLFTVIAVQMVPLNAMVIPLYLMMGELGQTNKLTGIIVIYMAVTIPFTLWTLRGFIINVPKDLEEAAMVDGCTRLGAFRRILFPLVAPGLVATSIFAIITVWNEYILAYVMLDDPAKQTLTVWLANFVTKQGTAWGPLMAASTLSALPVIGFFLLVHKRVVAGMTAGGVKG